MGRFLDRALVSAGPWAWPVRALFLLMFLGACPNAPAPAERNAPKAEAAAPVEPAVVGPQRVVSQVILADEILWELGEDARRRVVGVSPMADDPRYSFRAGVWPAEVPRARQDAETLLGLKPDLAIVANFTSVETTHLLDSAKVPMLRVVSFGGFDDYRGNVRAIADRLGLPEAGERVVAEFNARLAELRSKRTARPTVVSWVEGMVAGTDTSFDVVAEAAGLHNLPADRGLRGHQRRTLETLMTWNPAVIVIPCGAEVRPREDPTAPDTSTAKASAESCAAVATEFAARPGIQSLRAADPKRGAVIAAPSALMYGTGQGMLEFIALLQRRTASLTP